jgi:tetratricopeptide (TPR) repeat protein
METTATGGRRRVRVEPHLLVLGITATIFHGCFIASLWHEDILARRPIMDSAYYVDLAVRWASGGPIMPEGGLFLLAPGYAVFLASLVLVVGQRWLLVYVVQAALNIAGLLLVTDLARRRVGPWPAAVTGLLVAFYGPYQLYSASLLSEALIMPTVALMLWLHDRHRWLPVQAFLLGFAYLLRPNLGLFLVALLAWLALRDRPAFRVLVWSLLFVVAMPLFQWAVTGSAMGGSAQASVALYLGNHPRAEGLFTNVLGVRGSIPEQAEQVRRVTRERVGQPLSDREISKYWRRQVVAWATREPGAFATNGLMKVFRMLDNHQYATDRQWLADFPGAARLFPVPFGILLAVTASGLASRRVRERELAPSVIYLAAVIAGLLIFFPSARLRFALVPAMIPVGALGIQSLWRRSPGPLVAGVVVLALAIVGVRDHRRTEDPFGHFNRAAAFLEAGETAKARTFVDRALAVRWDVPFFHTLSAAVYRDEGNPEAWYRELRVAFRLGEADVGVVNALGAEALARGHWRLAEDVFRRAAEVYGDSAVPYVNLAQALLAQGRVDEAREAYGASRALGGRRRVDLERWFDVLPSPITAP